MYKDMSGAVMLSDTLKKKRETSFFNKEKEVRDSTEKVWF